MDQPRDSLTAVDAPEPAGSRRYDEKEVSRLLRRAADLQRESGAAPATTGLTLQELEEIAAEAGLEVASLRRAAAELDDRREDGSRAGRALAGGPFRLLYERTLPFEASAVALDSLPPMIEMAAEVPGLTNRAGNTLSWRSDDKVTPRRMRVVVSVRAGHTVIRIEESFGLLTGVSYGLIVAPSTGASFGIGAALAHALLSPALILGVPLAVVAASVSLVRFSLRSKIRSRRRLLERLLQDLAESLTGSTTERQLPA